MTRVAAIDCGTNSIRLLVADVDPGASTLVDVDRRMEVVRLGQGVDRTGRLAPEALARTFAACETYAEAVRRSGAERVRFVATSASRDVSNRDEFVAGVLSRLGVEPEVVTGEEEAALSFAGATRELVTRASGPVSPGPVSPGPGASALPTPFLVVDIGGGSTEFVLGDPGADPVAAASVDIGCVRMTERHFTDDPPTAAQVSTARADIEAAVLLAGETVTLTRGRTLVGLAGTVTTVAAMAMGLTAYEPEVLHHSRVTAADVHRIARELVDMSRDHRAALPFMHPGRVDVIGAGALILSVVLEHVPVSEVLVSEHDILDGIAWSLVT